MRSPTHHQTPCPRFIIAVPAKGDGQTGLVPGVWSAKCTVGDWWKTLKSECRYWLQFSFSFTSAPSSALISWSSTQVLLDRWGTFCAGEPPNVQFWLSTYMAVVGFEPLTSRLPGGHFTTRPHYPPYSYKLQFTLRSLISL